MPEPGMMNHDSYCTEYPCVWSKSTAVCPLNHFTRLSVTVVLYSVIVRDSAEENHGKHCMSWYLQVFMQYVYFNEESSAGVILSVLHMTTQTLSAQFLKVGKALCCKLLQFVPAKVSNAISTTRHWPNLCCLGALNGKKPSVVPHHLR